MDGPRRRARQRLGLTAPIRRRNIRRRAKRSLRSQRRHIYVVLVARAEARLEKPMSRPASLTAWRRRIALRLLLQQREIVRAWHDDVAADTAYGWGRFGGAASRRLERDDPELLVRSSVRRQIGRGPSRARDMVADARRTTASRNGVKRAHEHAFDGRASSAGLPCRRRLTESMPDAGAMGRLHQGSSTLPIVGP